LPSFKKKIRLVLAPVVDNFHEVTIKLYRCVLKTKVLSKSSTIKIGK
jgi:hypothetical protein